MMNMTDLADEFAAPAAAPRPTVASRIKAVLGHVSDIIVASRQQQADQIVGRYLAGQDNAALVKMGMSPAEIASVRAGTWRPSHLDRAGHE